MRAQHAAKVTITVLQAGGVAGYDIWEDYVFGSARSPGREGRKEARRREEGDVQTGEMLFCMCAPEESQEKEAATSSLSLLSLLSSSRRRLGLERGGTKKDGVKLNVVCLFSLGVIKESSVNHSEGVVLPLCRPSYYVMHKRPAHGL